MKDPFGREITYLRLSVTDKCNLRCRYCMPATGVKVRSHGEMLSEEEMLRAVRVCAALGVKKVRVTGGEPLVKKNILSICRGIAGTDGIEEVCLTTNGTLLPPLAKELRQAGVSRINISIDTTDAGQYAYITRYGTLQDAMAGLEAALDAGFEKIKINSVLIGGFNDSQVREIAALTVKYPVDVRFIELMPMKDNTDFPQASYVPSSVVTGKLLELQKCGSDGVARLYTLPGAKGNIGLISPLSNLFCSTCNRIRITADGKVKPCLHTAQEFSIKGLDEQGMRSMIERAVMAKPERHAPLSAASRSLSDRNMNQIGG